MTLEVVRGRVHGTGGSYAFIPISLGGRISGSGAASIKALSGPRVAYGPAASRILQVRARGTARGRQGCALARGRHPEVKVALIQFGHVCSASFVPHG
jgi:hypothetical protein